MPMPEGMTAIARHRQGWLGAELDRDALYWDFAPAHLAAIDELMEQVERAGLPFYEIRRSAATSPPCWRRSRTGLAWRSCAAFRSTNTTPSGCRVSTGASAPISDA